MATGLGITLQDRARVGWRRFGVPAGGPMDGDAAVWANRLLNNSPDAPLLEILLQGPRFLVLEKTWFALTGADSQSPDLPLWQAVQLNPGDVIRFPQARSGVWSYLAVSGGFAAELFLGGAGAYPRGGLGRKFAPGDYLCRRAGVHAPIPPFVASRSVALDERRDYLAPPALRLWPAPQTALFSDQDRAALVSEPWTVTAQSDRSGCRLSGPMLQSAPGSIISEPVRVGTIQVPPNGQPIVTMRDGPTVGGYPKLALIDPEDVSWIAQCRPGQSIRFVWRG